MSLWWLQPGWTNALCGSCGVNIHKSGGDPDWGYCYECMCQSQQQQEYPVDARTEQEVVEDMCQHQGRGYYGDDEVGPRCYCGKVREFPAIGELPE